MVNLENLTNVPQKKPDFSFKFIHKNDLNAISQIERLEEWLMGKVQDKLAADSLCLVAMDGNTVAGFNIVSFGEVFIPLINRHRNFRKTEAWSDQVTVNKQYRRRGLGSTLRFNIFKELKKRGVKKLYGGTLPSNKANLKLSKKVGLTEIVDIRYIKFFNRLYWKYLRIRNESN